MAPRIDTLVQRELTAGNSQKTPFQDMQTPEKWITRASASWGHSALVFLCSAGLWLAAVGPQAAETPAIQGATLKGRGRGGLKPPEEKELLYVALPGTLEGSWDQNGSGIVVLDVTDNFNFVKRIVTWDVPASRFPEQVAGVTASPVTQMIYVATRGRLAAWDLRTEKKAWENAFDEIGRAHV